MENLKKYSLIPHFYPFQFLINIKIIQNLNYSLKILLRPEIFFYNFLTLNKMLYIDPNNLDY